MYVLCQEFAPSDEELEAYRRGEEWDPKLAEQRRKVKVGLLARYSCRRNFISVISLPESDFLPLDSGNGSAGRSYVQSGEDARDVS